MGHAVCATYLYCGAADLYAETGEQAVLAALQRIWGNVTKKRMFITGGVGTGGGESTRGNPVHEAFLDDYQLPHDCYCETCSNIGNAMWNWRMLNITGDARYADIMERVLYNSGLSPVSIAQDRFFYCNPLVWNVDSPPGHKHHTATRWLIHDCYCCPPQVARTISKLQTWAYSIGEEGIWLNLYGGSTLETELAGETVALTQTTEYPWSGHVEIKVTASPETPFSLRPRIPGWAERASVKINGELSADVAKGGTYAELHRVWQAGDSVELDFPMPLRLMESHPEVAANRGRVAVMRGPLVYCVELPLSAGGEKTWKNGVYFPENIAFTPRFAPDLLGGVVVLEAEALTTAGKRQFTRDVVSKSEPATNNRSWKNVLYRPFSGRALKEPRAGEVAVSLIPYYAWANRGVAYMQVWTPLAR
ncbi:MAG: glycoside hydrolase family 127 protein [Planctomycetota bacterium]